MQEIAIYSHFSIFTAANEKIRVTRAIAPNAGIRHGGAELFEYSKQLPKFWGRCEHCRVAKIRPYAKTPGHRLAFIYR